MEGITDPFLRTAHARIFGGIGKYYTPFAAPNKSCTFKTREKRETAPELNSGVVLVPQVLTKDPEICIWFARAMAEQGYGEVNLNLGCPSATVCSHGKGAAMLEDTEALDRFLDAVFEGLGRLSLPVRLSVKTRIGYEENRAGELAELYGRYPLSELIVHARRRKDFYKGQPDLSAFRVFYDTYKGALCYNGDVCGPDFFEGIKECFPSLSMFMLGRGLIARPALPRMIAGGMPAEKEELKAFHDTVFEERMAALGGFANTAGKMKELWFYLGTGFRDARKPLKDIRKAVREDAYRAAVDGLFGSCTLKDPAEEVSFS